MFGLSTSYVDEVTRCKARNLSSMTKAKADSLASRPWPRPIVIDFCRSSYVICGHANHYKVAYYFLRKIYEQPLNMICRLHIAQRSVSF